MTRPIALVLLTGILMTFDSGLDNLEANAVTTSGFQSQPTPSKPESKPAKLRFDGVYRTPAKVFGGGADVPYFKYLRFFEDGTLVSATVDSPPQEVVTWLKKDVGGTVRWSERVESTSPTGEHHVTTKWKEAYTSRAQYKVSDTSIEFSLSRVDYKGTIEFNRLKLSGRFGAHPPENEEFEFFESNEKAEEKPDASTKQQ